jgi:hypothetical protein
MARWPPLREEELAARLRARDQARSGSIGLFAAAGGILVVSAVSMALGKAGASLALGPLLALLAWGLRRKAASTDIHPRLSLPTWEELPPDDPRRALPLEARRRIWRLGLLFWLGGWALAGLFFYALRGSGAIGWLRLPLVLGSSIGGVLLGSAWVEARTGSREWPSR